MPKSSAEAHKLIRPWAFELYCAAAALFLALLPWLRGATFTPDPLLYGLLHIVSGVAAFTFVASALVRFRGTRNRSALVLAFGFALAGAFTISASFGFFRQTALGASDLPVAPLPWWISRTLLAALMLLALPAGRNHPEVRHPGREIGIALVLVALSTYLTTALYPRLPAWQVIYPEALVPRPLHLLAAAIFFLAAIGFGRRPKSADTAFDRGLRISAWLNVACDLAAAETVRLHDVAFGVSQLLMVAGYAVALGGALVENARVFDRVHQLASSDPLTGLGNYRCLLDVLETEVQRSGRTGRPFAVVLLDLDGLKRLNDHHGHLVGSQALCRLANILRVNCRSIDTATRYGGDEFALILPETDERAAQEVAARICDRLAADLDGPRLSVSVGVAIYPHSGLKIEQLLAGADEALYAMKAERRIKSSESPSTTTGWLFER